MSLSRSRHTLLVAFVGGFMLLAGALFFFNQPVEAGGRPLTAALSGANEVPPVDSGGSGMMSLTLNQGQEEICWNLTLSNVDSPTRAHIHRGVAGENGGVEVFFFDTVVGIPVPDPLAGCVTVDADLVKEIRQNPDQFYINVHNADYPAGVVRGQLSK